MQSVSITGVFKMASRRTVYAVKVKGTGYSDLIYKIEKDIAENEGASDEHKKITYLSHSVVFHKNVESYFVAILTYSEEIL